MLLQDHCEAVANALTRDEFQAALVRFAHDLGFGFMAAMAVYERPHGKAEFVAAHNTPAAYLPLFDSGVGQFDPVMQHCKRSGLPIAWDQSTYVRAGHGERWEEMAPYGYQTGISMALHLPHGRHFVLGVDGDRALPKNQKQLARMVAHLVSVLMSAQESGLRLLPFMGACAVDHHSRQVTEAELSPLSSICSPKGGLPPTLMHEEFCPALGRLGAGSNPSQSILKARLHKPIH